MYRAEKIDQPGQSSFRDSIATVSKEGKRKWIYPKKPSGKFYNARTAVSILLLLILFITPFVKLNGRPIFLFDFLNRTFILFGLPFGPHDFHLFVLAMIAIIVFIILFTAAYGRIFCGWICPQTVFMEMVFRKIEYWVEGDAKSQQQLSNALRDSKKIIKKVSKHSIFFILSFIISNVFLAYIIGIDKLLNIVTAPPSEHLNGLIAMLLFSGVFYWVFAYFREQACTIVCPYGRLQGVLLDRDSIVIAYDHIRGEPRSKFKRNSSREKLGYCIDCSLCVDVCPTGIDIRNGIQLECVNCAACIDACDSVMEKVNFPKGLIRYASINSIENKAKFRITPRVAGYSTLLILLISLLGYLISTRTDFNINILRTPGMIFQEQPGGMISNMYDFNIVNKTFERASIELKLAPSKGELKLIGDPIILKPQEKHEAKFLILIPKAELKKMNNEIKLKVFSNNKLIKETGTSFLAPRNKEEKL